MPAENPELIARMSRWLTSTQLDLRQDEVLVEGIPFVVYAGVFSPRYYSETAFYAAHLIPRLRPGSSLLDLGCGAGVNSVLAALRGVSVTALDLNPRAVRNTRDNMIRHGIDRIDVRESDVFSGLAAQERFDTVYWNVPFAYREPGVTLSSLEEAIFDPGLRKQQAFLEGARNHLTVAGEVLMGVSPTLGDVAGIGELARALGFAIEVVAEAEECEVPDRTVLQLLRLWPDEETKA